MGTREKNMEATDRCVGFRVAREKKNDMRVVLGCGQRYAIHFLCPTDHQ